MMTVLGALGSVAFVLALVALLLRRDSGIAERARAFRRDGQSGSATVIAVKYTGTILNGDQEYELKLESPLASKLVIKTPVAALNVPRIQQGQVVPIVYAAENAQRAVLDLEPFRWPYGMFDK